MLYETFRPLKEKQVNNGCAQMKHFHPLYTFTILMIFAASVLPAQEKKNLEDELQSFHFGGLSFGRETRVLLEDYQNDSREKKDTIGSFGLEYCGLIGSRLGFYTDFLFQIPGNVSEQKGFLLDFTSGIGWNIWIGNWGLLPGLGFHSGYTYLQNDPFGDGGRSFFLSFGPGGGIKLLYRINRDLIFFTGFLGSFDTLQFSDNRQFRDRDNSFKESYSGNFSLGAGLEL